MSAGLASLLVIVSLATAFISGIFGMAGGMILMGVLAMLLPVQAALVTHGTLQLASNGARAILHRSYVKLPILSWFALATLAASVTVWLIAWVPTKAVVFLMLGLMPMLLWIPKSWFTPDAARPGHAFLSGFLAAALNLTAGVSGPLIDTLFVRTGLTRHEIVATKAAVQSLNHISKIVVYGILLMQAGEIGLPPLWLFLVAIPASWAGTAAGGRVLDKISDANFKRWTAWIVTIIGGIYFLKAGQILWCAAGA